jgi:hypothetical protein
MGGQSLNSSSWSSAPDGRHKDSSFVWSLAKRGTRFATRQRGGRRQRRRRSPSAVSLPDLVVGWNFGSWRPEAPPERVASLLASSSSHFWKDFPFSFFSLRFHETIYFSPLFHLQDAGIMLACSLHMKVFKIFFYGLFIRLRQVSCRVRWAEATAVVQDWDRWHLIVIETSTNFLSTIEKKLRFFISYIFPIYLPTINLNFFHNVKW